MKEPKKQLHVLLLELMETHGDAANLPLIAHLLKAAEINRGYDKLIAAWKKCSKDANYDECGVIESLQEQKMIHTSGFTERQQFLMFRPLEDNDMTAGLYLAIKDKFKSLYDIWEYSEEWRDNGELLNYLEPSRKRELRIIFKNDIKLSIPNEVEV